jgi:hypothetical protein|tara:strand:- start:347 stop:592 length:246 start_codon:yes stop_codon:yes gene_type:complete
MWRRVGVVNRLGDVRGGVKVIGGGGFKGLRGVYSSGRSQRRPVLRDEGAEAHVDYIVLMGFTPSLFHTNTLDSVFGHLSNS